MKPIHWIVGLLLLVAVGAWTLKQKLYPAAVCTADSQVASNVAPRVTTPAAVDTQLPDKPTVPTQNPLLTGDDVLRHIMSEPTTPPDTKSGSDPTPPAKTDDPTQPIFVPTPPPDLLDPHEMARSSLPFVGADPVADVVWFNAINDPTIPAKQRSDLIEDLNEDSFPDPKNITSDDLPLIMSRMELIEQIAADAMDETNAKAFAEAYKDLTKLLIKVSQE